MCGAEFPYAAVGGGRGREKEGGGQSVKVGRLADTSEVIRSF